MSRWLVESIFSYKSPERVWVARDGGFLHVCEFPTWREAQDYADRQARTVEVVLPREHIESLRGFGIWGWSNGDCTITNGLGNLTVEKDRIKTLALALLAHHYKENQK